MIDVSFSFDVDTMHDIRESSSNASTKDVIRWFIRYCHRKIVFNAVFSELNQELDLVSVTILAVNITRLTTEFDVLFCVRDVVINSVQCWLVQSCESFVTHVTSWVATV